jgi:hypothetical protein
MVFDVCKSPYFQNWSRTVGKIVINENTIALFEQVLSQNPPQTSDSVDDLMNNFTSKMRQIVDDIAPVKVEKVINKYSAPWRKNPMVQWLNKEKGNAERPRENGVSPNYKLTTKFIKTCYGCIIMTFARQGRYFSLILLAGT